MAFLQYNLVTSSPHAHNPIAIQIDETFFRQRAGHALASMACIHATSITWSDLQISCHFVYAENIDHPQGFLDQIRAVLIETHGFHLTVSHDGAVTLRFCFPNEVLITVPIGFAPPLDRRQYQAVLNCGEATPEHAQFLAMQAATQEASCTTVRH